MIEREFLGYNDYPIHIYIWDGVENPKGVVQIVHGMAEHARRYSAFAEYLNSKGYIVIADDHRGHGRTAGKNLGMVPDGDCFNDTLQDLIKLTYYAIGTYKLPVTLFGHSYGSFLSQAYIQKAGDIINGAVLCGSARQPSALVSMGAAIANMQLALFGKDKEGKLLNTLSFGGYNKKFKSEGSDFAWLSKNPDNVRRYEEDRMCGNIMSIGFYASFFNALKGLYTKEGLSNIRKSLPIFVISGSQDPVGGYSKYVKELFNTYKSIGINDVSMKLYDELRHEILNEKENETVYQDILNFADRCNLMKQNS